MSAGTGLTLEEWAPRVPELVTTCRERWGLRLGEPYPRGAAGYAVRAAPPDGTRAVLKVIYPHRESEQEADALARWDGDGAVRLLARDDELHALLLERCEPGTFLSERPAEEALGVLIGLLPRLWVDAEGFRPLQDEAAWWESYLEREWEEAGRPYERRLVDAALDALRTLPRSQGEQVLVHQDLHGDNVLAAQREPWLVIDPKPLSGERELAAAPVVRSLELGETRRDVLYRLDRLSAELGLDRERVRGWTIAQTLAWSGGSDLVPEHVELVRRLVEA
ncbi:MAG TPA: aminoglycoside phosphotransferase family protein [Gaiellaceae bacterium]|jgi:streptomycin 6-kinase